ncbi:MAG: PAS domain-containing protein [Chloroflexi bacterium]|nr:PAS domain-containing protein [Chloroflexota bacterium]
MAYDGLIADAARVLDTLVNVDQEIVTVENRWYKVEIRPYRTTNNSIDGLVLTFSDITLQKQAQHQAEQTSSYVRDVIDTVDEALLELDSDLRVVAANASFLRQFQAEASETVGHLLTELGNGQWDIPELRHLLTEIIPQHTVVMNYTMTHDFPQLGRRTMHLNARQVSTANRILLVITDLSE